MPAEKKTTDHGFLNWLSIQKRVKRSGLANSYQPCTHSYQRNEIHTWVEFLKGHNLISIRMASSNGKFFSTTLFCKDMSLNMTLCWLCVWPKAKLNFYFWINKNFEDCIVPMPFLIFLGRYLLYLCTYIISCLPVFSVSSA